MFEVSLFFRCLYRVLVVLVGCSLFDGTGFRVHLKGRALDVSLYLGPRGPRAGVKLPRSRKDYLFCIYSDLQTLCLVSEITRILLCERKNLDEIINECAAALASVSGRHHRMPGPHLHQH